MDQEQNNKPQETEAEIIVNKEDPSETDQPKEEKEELQESTTETPSDAADRKKSRIIVGGLAATIIVSLIAVLVAAIFQLTSRWLITCPTDLPVNDPAPVLWNNVISENGTPFRLGVPEDIMKEAGFKGAQSEPEKKE